MEIKRISCTSCGGSRFARDEDGNLVCQFCGTQYQSLRDEILCRVCGTLNPGTARRCMNCGLILGRQCPVCAHVNPPGADHCEECASPLDALTSLTTRAQEMAGERFTARSQRLVASKRADMVYMAGQRAELDAEEEERLTRLAERSARARQEQQLLVFALAGIALLIAVGVIIAIGVFTLNGS